MNVEETDDYIFRAKTGWALIMNAGWYVDYVKRKNNVYFFATCVRGNEFSMENFGRCRMEITRKILNDLKII